VTSPEYFDSARQLIADWSETVAVLRRSGMTRQAAVEAAGLLLADRLDLVTVAAVV
jgi:hypothetical protein